MTNYHQYPEVVPSYAAEIVPNAFGSDLEAKLRVPALVRSNQDRAYVSDCHKRSV